MKVGELFVQLGVKADTFTVRDFAKAIGDIPLAAAGAITSLAGLTYGFVEFTKHTIDTANQLAIFRSETGLSTDQLQRWQLVAREVGVSGDVVAASVGAISDSLAKLRTGSGGTEILAPLGKLGVDIRGKNAFQILESVAQASRGRNPADVATLLKQIGIAPEMMSIFQMPEAQRLRAMNRAPTMGAGDIAAMQALNKSLIELHEVVEKNLIKALGDVAPYMKDIAELLGVIVAGMVRTLGKDAHGLNELRKGVKEAGGWGTFIAGLVNQGLITPETSRDYANSLKHETHIHQEIHSNADAEEVAVVAGRHVTRAMTKAMKQFNNGGR